MPDDSNTLIIASMTTKPSKEAKLIAALRKVAARLGHSTSASLAVAVLDPVTRAPVYHGGVAWRPI